MHFAKNTKHVFQISGTEIKQFLRSSPINFVLIVSIFVNNRRKQIIRTRSTKGTDSDYFRLARQNPAYQCNTRDFYLHKTQLRLTILRWPAAVIFWQPAVCPSVSCAARLFLSKARLQMSNAGPGEGTAGPLPSAHLPLGRSSGWRRWGGT